VTDGDAVRVTREGVAFVHLGETISAAPGAEAEGEVIEDPRLVVHYHFPVHIEVHAQGQDEIASAIERTLNTLAAAIDSV